MAREGGFAKSASSGVAPRINHKAASGVRETGLCEYVDELADCC